MTNLLKKLTLMRGGYDAILLDHFAHPHHLNQIIVARKRGYPRITDDQFIHALYMETHPMQNGRPKWETVYDWAQKTMLKHYASL